MFECPSLSARGDRYTPDGCRTLKVLPGDADALDHGRTRRASHREKEAPLARQALRVVPPTGPGPRAGPLNGNKAALVNSAR